MANNLPGTVNKNLFDTIFWDYVYGNGAGGPFSLYDKLDGVMGDAALTGVIAASGLSGDIQDATATPGFSTVDGWAGRAAFPATASVLMVQAAGVTSSSIVIPTLQTIDGTLTSLLPVVVGDTSAAVIVTFASVTSGNISVVVNGAEVEVPFNTSNNQTVDDLATAITADVVASVRVTAAAASGVLTLTIKSTYLLGYLGNAATITAAADTGTAVITSTVVTGTTADTGLFQNGGNVKFTGNASATGTTKLGFIAINP